MYSLILASLLSPINQVKHAIETGESWRGKHVVACVKEDCVEIDRSGERVIVDKDGNLIEPGENPGGPRPAEMIDALQAAGSMFKVGARGKIKIIVDTGEGATHKRVEIEVEIEVKK